MDKSKLTSTQQIRFIIDQIEKETYAGRIFKHLYEINTETGSLVPGHVMETEPKFVALAAEDRVVHQKWIKELPATQMYEKLGMNWSKSSGIISKFVRDGIIHRRRQGAKRFVSLKPDILHRLHEAVTTGVIRP